MGRKVVLCAVSRMRSGAEEASYTYESDNGGRKYPGAQTNEAPVKCIIDRFRPIDTVYCLTSEEVKAQTQGGESDWEFFRRKVRAYCGDTLALPCPAMECVPYDIHNPSRSVAPLLALLQDEDEVYLDVTGGGRDAVFLMTLVMQLLQYKHIRVGCAVYSDLNNKCLRRWESEFALFDLLKAVEDFVSYGKAGKLAAYFKDRKVPKSISRFCRYANQFSLDLELCRTHQLEETVESIQKAMRSAGSASVQAAPDVQLFLSLIPEMQRQFIPERDSRAALLLDTIDWCTRHELWLQALALYRENVPQCLFELGLVESSPAFEQYFDGYLRGKWKSAAIPEVGSRDWCTEVVRALYPPQEMHTPQFHAKDKGLTIHLEQETWRAVLRDWDELRLIRNAALHNQEPDDARSLPDEELEPDRVAEKLDEALRRLRAAL